MKDAGYASRHIAQEKDDDDVENLVLAHVVRFACSGGYSWLAKEGRWKPR